MILFLRYGRKIPVEEQHFQKRYRLQYVLDKVHLLLIFIVFPYPLSPGKTFFPQSRPFPPLPDKTNSKPPPPLLPPFSRHIDNNLSVYLFLEFEQQLGKSKEFNNQGMNENRAFRSYFFLSPKNNEKADSLCIKFSGDPNDPNDETSKLYQFITNRIPKHVQTKSQDCSCSCFLDE